MHPDHDDLAVAALGQADESTERHLEECAECRDVVAGLARVVEAGRIGPLQAPPSRVWDAIEAEIDTDAEVVELQPRRRRSWTLLAVAAACGALLVIAVQRLLLPGPLPVVSAADLEPLPGWSVTGTAEVLNVDGGRELRVELPDDGASGYREVWLISEDLERLVSLGVLTDDAGAFTIPPGLDLGEFAVVDISDEPLDGDPSHSGVSIVRGVLES